MEAEPRIVLALRRTRRFVRHWGKPRFTLIVVLPAERVAHTVPWPGRRLPCQTQLNQRPVRHLSKSAVDWTTQWRDLHLNQAARRKVPSRELMTSALAMMSQPDHCCHPPPSARYSWTKLRNSSPRALASVSSAAYSDL